MKVNLNKWQRVTILAIILGLLFNPMSVEVLDPYFKMAYTVISVGCSVWVVGFMLYHALRPQPLNIPKKKVKAKNHDVRGTMQYIET